MVPDEMSGQVGVTVMKQRSSAPCDARSTSNAG